jgi:hypothetical protein
MPTRRSVLSGAAGLIAGAAGSTLASQASASAASPALAPSGPSAPAVQARRARLAAGTTRATASFPLSHLSITWEGPATGVSLRLRTASGWSGWKAAEGCPGGKDGMAGPQVHGALVAATGVLGYEVALAPGIAAPAITELNTAEPADAARSRRTRGTAMSPLLGSYVTRAGWGCDESLRFKNGVETWPDEYFPVQLLTVHHQGDDTDDAHDPAATMRAIYRLQAVDKGWGDFGYHLGIDRDGRFYEGRYSGSDFFPIFGGNPGADGRPQMANAGHAVGYNAGNVGIVLLGNLSKQPVAPAQVRALTGILTILAAVCRIDPVSTVNYVNPISGAKITTNGIAAHREFVATECPGNNFAPLLDQVRKDVARNLGHPVKR